jgi:Tir chaperone family protein CesT
MSTALELLKAFAADRQLADFAPDGEGRAGLTVDGKVHVDLKADGDRLYVYASLGALPQSNQQTVLGVLLVANLEAGLGQGPVMSIDPTLGDIVLGYELDARSAGSAAVLRAVGMLAEQVAEWRQRIDEIAARPTDAEAPPRRPEHAANLMNRA